MSIDPIRPLEMQVAHVLFMDIVGFSLLPMAEQTRLFQHLQILLRGTDEYHRSESRGDMIGVPRGDGNALVFFSDPVAPVRCAMEVSRALRTFPDLRLRMGIHSGPVHRVEDINTRPDVTGGGINLAQRTMDCGDAGHILVSSTVAEFLKQLDEWAPYLHDLGECEVKHGARIHLYNFYNAGVGNSELPQTLAARVAILYRRRAKPDTQVMEMLEDRLTAVGFRVFIDRHLTVGEEWAREIERQVRTADAVIPLLSEQSIGSEMLECEIQIAHEAAQKDGGKPQLLPVRVQYAGPLPEATAAILDPLQYVLWDGAADDDRIFASLVEALRRPPAPPSVQSIPAVSAAAPETSAPVHTGRPPIAGTPFGARTPWVTGSSESQLEAVGGAVPLDSSFYVVRKEDEVFYTALARQDSIVLVKGARQMGKTSLLARGLQRQREAGAKVVQFDFQTLTTAHLESANSLYLALAQGLADVLDLDAWPDEVWNERRGPNVNFERYLRKEVLEKATGPVVWGLDEVDRIFTSDFGSEVFGLFRSWHNKRSLDPTGPWSRLTLAIAYAREAHLFITDVNQSPFNVGTPVTLEDFTFDQVEDLNARHGSPLKDDAEVARYMRLVGGHPYLVRRGLLQMASQGMSVAALEAEAGREEGIFGDHLRRILVLLVKDPELCDVVRGVLRGQPCPTPDSFYRLRASGVMSGESARDVRPRCQLYATYLERQLL